MAPRVLAVHPGPDFSVADVHVGLVAGLRANGCEVVDFNLHDRLSFYSQVAVHRDGEWRRALDTNGVIRMTAVGVEAAALEVLPDVVVFTSCLFVPAHVMDVLRARGMRVVNWFTESPYEDEGQLLRAAHADLNVLNDPTNLARFAEVAPSVYVPAAHDPARHCWGPPLPDLASDFAFVGTGFASRIEFFEAVDWSGIDVALAGMWQATHPDSPLRKFLVHDIDECFDNEQTVDLYRSAKVSANLYRREGEEGAAPGWAMGPREVELAATGTFFLRDPRPEGDEVLSMLPTFDGPEDFVERLRWWVVRDAAREAAALAAQAAVADRTFDNNAAALLRHLGF